MKLKQLRESKGFTQLQVAKKLDVDQGAVSKWENGVNRPVAKYRKKLSKLYGVTVDELLKPDEKEKHANESINNYQPQQR